MWERRAKTLASSAVVPEQKGAHAHTSARSRADVGSTGIQRWVGLSSLQGRSWATGSGGPACYWPNTCYWAPSNGRLLLANGRLLLPLATYCYPPDTGRLSLAADDWPPAAADSWRLWSDRLLLAACCWPRSERLLLASDF